MSLDLRLLHATTAIVTLWLAGCASVPHPNPNPNPEPSDIQRRTEFDKALDSWNGAPLAELLKKVGKPNAVTRRSDGSSVYSFTKSTSTRLLAGQPGFSCTVRYVVDGKTQRVRGHQIEGC